MLLNTLKPAFRVLAIFLLVGLPCPSQFETRSVTGIVTDKKGNALRGAAVQLKNGATLWVDSYITGKDGRYRFDSLSDDIDYTLKAQYKKHWSEPKTLSMFNSSKHPEIALVIPID